LRGRGREVSPRCVKEVGGKGGETETETETEKESERKGEKER
jgi:hypothetical protein